MAGMLPPLPKPGRARLLIVVPKGEQLVLSSSLVFQTLSSHPGKASCVAKQRASARLGEMGWPPSLPAFRLSLLVALVFLEGCRHEIVLPRAFAPLAG